MMHTSLLEELQYFFINGTTADFVVAVIFGQSFSIAINSMVTQIILPVLSALIYKVDVDSLDFLVNGVPINYGQFLGHFATFVLSMLLVFFIFIKPFKGIIDESKEKEASQTAKAINSLQNIELMLKSSSQRLRL